MTQRREGHRKVWVLCQDCQSFSFNFHLKWLRISSEYILSHFPHENLAKNLNMQIFCHSAFEKVLKTREHLELYIKGFQIRFCYCAGDILLWSHVVHCSVIQEIQAEMRQAFPGVFPLHLQARFVLLISFTTTYTFLSLTKASQNEAWGRN